MTEVTISAFPFGWSEGYLLLAELHRAAFSDQEAQIWSADDFRLMVESPGVRVFLATSRDQLVGFILIRLIHGEAELISMGVSPDCYGQGIGGRLLDQVTGFLADQGAETFFLEVRADNRIAQTLYKSRGFRETGKRSRYYQTQSGKRIDALCFTLFMQKQNSSK